MFLVQQLVGKLCQNIDLWSCVSHHHILALVPPSVFIHFSSSGKYLGAAGNSKTSRTFYLTQGKPPWWLHQLDGSLWPLGHLPSGGLCSGQLPLLLVPILLPEVSGFLVWFLMPFPSAVRSPLSLCKTPWTCRVTKAYHKSV